MGYLARFSSRYSRNVASRCGTSLQLPARKMHVHPLQNLVGSSPHAVWGPGSFEGERYCALILNLFGLEARKIFCA